MLDTRGSQQLPGKSKGEIRVVPSVSDAAVFSLEQYEMVKATAGEDASRQATAASRVVMEENFMVRRVLRCALTIGFFGDGQPQSMPPLTDMG
jgi:hypothetical protein